MANPRGYILRMTFDGGNLQCEAGGDLPAALVNLGLDLTKANLLAKLASDPSGLAERMRASIRLPVRKADMPQGD